MFESYNGILLIAAKRAINKTKVFRLCSAACNLISKMQNENVGNAANSYFISIRGGGLFSYFSQFDSP